jgi:hypothetical protein
MLETIAEIVEVFIVIGGIDKIVVLFSDDVIEIDSAFREFIIPGLFNE